MIAVHELIDEIADEAVRRAGRLRVVRVNPATFQRIAGELNARVDEGDGHGRVEFTMFTAVGRVRFVSDESATVADHLYFEDAEDAEETRP